MQVGQENVEAPVLIIGDYLFEPEIGLISGPGGAHRVCAQTSALLWYLVERHGKAVTREDLIRDVWHDSPGAARALTSGIARLRHYFGDTAKDARYIETVPAKGYRLVSAVYGGTRGQAEAEPAPKTAAKTRSTRRLARFILELRDRKVCRAMLLYALSVWLIAQVSEIIAPALLLPEWFTTFVVVVGILGFPAAALLAWVFEIKPGGIYIDVPRLPANYEAPPRRRVDFVVDMSMIAGAVLLSGQLFVNTLSGEAVALPDKEATLVTQEQAGPAVHRIAVSPLSLSSGSVEANAVGHRFIDSLAAGARGIHRVLAGRRAGDHAAAGVRTGGQRAQGFRLLGRRSAQHQRIPAGRPHERLYPEPRSAGGRAG